MRTNHPMSKRAALLLCRLPCTLSVADYRRALRFWQVAIEPFVALSETLRVGEDALDSLSRRLLAHETLMHG